MIYFNQNILTEKEFHLTRHNRAFKYGDGIFDTLKYTNGKIEFIEDHYFRLMSSMRMLRMKIPMYFSLQFYKAEILKLLSKNDVFDKARIRVSIFRKDGGLYNPLSNEINILMETGEVNLKHHDSYEIELFKDFPVYSGLLSNIKTTNRMINVVASIYASEFNYNNCILINEKKNIVEAINANIFLIKGNDIYTPSLTEGCINGIIRKKIIEAIKNNDQFQIHETSISPFELLKADEVFISNSIIDFESVTIYRKTIYRTEKTNVLKKLFADNFS